jgi:methionyl aminopeptidase
MSYTKTTQEQQLIREGGQLLGEILEYLGTLARAGVSAYEIDLEAEERILKVGGRPSFKGFRSRRSDPPFPSTICASRNEEVVHGIASKTKVLQNGDIFTIDIGMEYPVKSGLGRFGNGFFTDTALTVPVGTLTPDATLLLERTYEALMRGIEVARVGQSVASIGKAIEAYIKPFGYGIVRDLVGHGVGYLVHEDPRVPNYYDASLEKIELRPGMVLAIEPMITLGTHEVDTAPDGWSISTTDGSLSAHFEHTIIVTEGKPIVATKRPGEVF